MQTANRSGKFHYVEGYLIQTLLEMSDLICQSQ